MNKPFIITIVGAESSGKTTLAMELAEHFQCPWIPEYAREYLSALDRPYGERDLEIIAERQWEAILSVVNRESSAVSRESSAYFAPNPLKGTLHDTTSSQTPLIDLIQSQIVSRKSTIVIVDGGIMNLRMWAKIKYKKTIEVVEKALEEDITDLYLLCRPHKEWTHDPLREAPDLLDRVWIYNLYLIELAKGINAMEILDGDKDQRLEKAIQIIENIPEVQ